jgi:hypothetical protein
VKFEQGKRVALLLANGPVVYGRVVVSHPERVVLDDGGFTAVESLRGALTGAQPLALDRVPGEFQVSKGAIMASFDAENCTEGDPDQ